MNAEVVSYYRFGDYGEALANHLQQVSELLTRRGYLTYTIVNTDWQRHNGHGFAKDGGFYQFVSEVIVEEGNV